MDYALVVREPLVLAVHVHQPHVGLGRQLPRQGPGPEHLRAVFCRFDAPDGGQVHQKAVLRQLGQKRPGQDPRTCWNAWRT